MMTASDHEAGTCLNCGAPVEDAFCPKCGQDNRERRLTARRIFHQTIHELLDLEQPMLRTLVNLSWRPGWVALEFVRGRRRAFTNPLKYCLIAATIVTIAMNLSDVDIVEMQQAAMPETDDPEQQQGYEAVAQISRWFVEYIGAIIALTLPVLAIAMRLLFWRSPHNIVEHYTMALYAYGQVFLFQAMMIPFGLYEHPIVSIVYNALPVIWFTLAAMQFCHGRWWYILLMSIVGHIAYFAFLSAGLFAASIFYTLWFAG